MEIYQAVGELNRYDERPSAPKLNSQVSGYYDRRSNEAVRFGEFRTLPETASERFARLTREWLDATSTLSSLDDIVNHPAHQQIIAMKEAAIPLILADLSVAPKHWFYALRKITGANPIPKNAAGDLSKMTAAWLKWGRRKSYC